MQEENNKNKNTYQCKECGLHYKDKSIYEKCEAWCKEHKTCNVEISKQSEENKNYQRDPASLINELEQCNKKCEEYLNNWKRERADFLNYKKDEAERIGTLLQYAKESIILNILPILDNIELAEKQLPENLKKGEKGSPQAIEWTKGFLQIKKQIKDFLKRERIEEIETLGKQFNPKTMEAMSEETGGRQQETSTVIEEIQKGYIMEGKVIRPAKVKVTK